MRKLFCVWLLLSLPVCVRAATFLCETPLKNDDEKIVCAMSYAEICGFNLYDVQNLLLNYSGYPSLLETLMQHYPGATHDQVGYCETAMDILRSIGSAPNRSATVNELAAYIGLTSAGTLLSYVADENNDGIADSYFDSCSGGSWKAKTTKMGSHLWEVYRSVEAANSPDLEGIRTLFDAISTALIIVDDSYNFLSPRANPDLFTRKQWLGIRSLVNTSEVGVGYCSGFGACMCQ